MTPKTALKDTLGPHDDKAKVLSAQKARQGVATGRVLLVLGVSVVLLTMIYAIMWLSHATL